MRDFLSGGICVIVSLVLVAIGVRFVSDVWIFATIQSLQLHLSLGCVAALLLALLFRRGLLPVLLLAASISLIAHGVWLTQNLTQPDEPPSAAGPTLRLMSFNVLMSNLENGEAIRDSILASGADVVNIMEAEPLLPHLVALSAVYPYRIGCGEMTRRCDLMMLSKLPLSGQRIVSLSDVFEERLMLATVSFDGRPLHIAAIHTTKPYFDEFQSHELGNAARVLNRLKGPLLVSGDFNASSLAPNIRQFLRWTGLRKAGWEPPTWPTELGWAGVPIDHVYVRPPLGIASLDRLPEALGSNHFGLMAEIRMPEN